MENPTATTTEVHDVVVVGARCAGAATAMLLARLGHDVVVVDRVTFPSDTLSTHGIAHSGVVQLDRWGLLDRVLESGAPPIRQISFHTGRKVITRAVKERAGVDLLVAPRRDVLDSILVDAAIEDGAEVRTGVSVADVTRNVDGRVDGIVGTDAEGRPVQLRGRHVVGADGLRSRIARAVGAPITEERHRNGAVRYAYVAGLGAEGTELHLGADTFAGIFPTHGGEANTWVCGPVDVLGELGSAGERGQRFHDLLHRTSPALAERVHDAEQTSPVRGFSGMPNQLRQAAGPGWALVGDAGYFRDAITGHGISDAFRDAEMLARALDQALQGEPDDAALGRYAIERDHNVAEIFDITCRLAAYPPRAAFVELQKRLSAAIEREAEMLAALAPIPRRAAVCAA